MSIVKIKAGFSGVISTGAYQNERPFYEVELVDKDLNLNQIKEKQTQLQELCREAFKAQERRSIAERIAAEREDIRFYPLGNDQYPSVTSIINWDVDFYIPPHELVQYAARGTIIHKLAEIFIKTGEWKDPQNVPECYPDLVVLKKGNLKLSIENYNFPGFIKKYPIEYKETEKAYYNHDLNYAGTLDIKGTLNNKITLFDIKTSSTIDKRKSFKQLTAYAHCKDNEDVEQLCIIHLKPDNESGFAKPIIETDTNKYWSLFRKDRENFKKRFGV